MSQEQYFSPTVWSLADGGEVKPSHLASILGRVSKEEILDLYISLVVTSFMVLFLISPRPTDSKKVSSRYWWRGNCLVSRCETGPASANWGKFSPKSVSWRKLPSQYPTREKLSSFGKVILLHNCFIRRASAFTEILGRLSHPFSVVFSSSLSFNLLCRPLKMKLLSLLSTFLKI